ncbi:6,7-dimethyl-8-ribityllumazine synthase [Haliangium ochraceum]|uniref:6,7-dimethyl-8-ribityllumazine synthase n=1 Tax=Haliangium ochraceum (strain DSM 14365 / JCM 11303 / SMP-2) TaxID=502025 RepID=D0LW50_HALO1|nr:6,7-dimethyl-8-ribityllumazine synthase [Haliangium ochraceum]ACY15982.1 6,7-dimethyl-8-ribityllumazine synthase [Haliangium ochraceum DSM 14365]
MPKVFEGKLTSTGLRVGIVCGRFNGFIVQSLLEGAVDAVVRSGGSADSISVYWCPGAYEIPQVLREVVARGSHDAVVCLGAVIRGSTPHFDYVAGEVSKGISQVAAGAEIPVTFGVLTTDTIEQAIERAGTKAGNKGFESAMAAIEMVNLFRMIRGAAQ